MSHKQNMICTEGLILADFMAVTTFGHEKIMAQNIKHNKFHRINHRSMRTCSHK